MACALIPAGVASQPTEPQSVSPPIARAPDAPWAVAVEAYLYLEPDELLLMPVIFLDRNAWHLEGRFQYEDRNTGSIWAGWRFEAGNLVQLEVVPMAGLVFGRTTGVAPGFELTLAWKDLEFYSEHEYVFDVRDADRNFGYTWSELGWQVHPMLRLGVAAQRTAEHRGARWVDRGAFATVSHGPADLSFYWFNLEPGTRFATVALRVDF
jgi:hypothetical protein